MSIPLVDLSLQHRAIETRVRRELDRLFEGGQYVLGPQVEDFERAYGEFVGVRHCVGVANGTDALELALRALGVGAGDEVILPANTFIASALAVVRAGATPVLVDSEPRQHQIDIDQVEAKIGPRTRAIMAVDLFGQIPDLPRLERIAEAHGVALVEDAAQAQGARRAGRGAGAFGRIAGTSFYPGKNLGAYGDAGAITTGDDELAGRVRRLRNYGSEQKYSHPEIGFNSRLDSMQAIVLTAKLAHLAQWNDERRRAAAYYAERLGAVEGVEAPAVDAANDPVWHLYVVRVRERDRILAALHAGGIGAGVHYPLPIHLQGAFACLGHARGDFPVAERAAREILSLPIYPGIREEQQDEVVDALEAALAAEESSERG